MPGRVIVYLRTYKPSAPAALTNQHWNYGPSEYFSTRRVLFEITSPMAEDPQE